MTPLITRLLIKQPGYTGSVKRLGVKYTRKSKIDLHCIAVHYTSLHGPSSRLGKKTFFCELLKFGYADLAEKTCKLQQI